MKNKKKIYKKSFWRSMFVGSDDIEAFLENLALMLSVNVSLQDILGSIAEESNNKYFQKILRNIAHDVNSGFALAESMKNARVFKEYTLELIDSGERSGSLLKNLELILEQKAKERNLRSNIFSAMVYPVFVTIIGALAGIVIFGFVLPRVTRVFAQLNVDLPWLTIQIVNFGNFIGDHGNVFIPSVLSGGLLLFLILFVFRYTKFLGQGILLRLPVLGRLLKEIELARFGFNLGTLLKAGITLDRAVGSLSSLTGLKKYSEFYEFLASQINKGKTFHEVFESYDDTNELVPIPIQQIIESGEMSASLSLSFDRIGEIFEHKTEATTKALITLLEPLLLFVVWLGVGGIALSIIIPIYSLIGNFGTRNADPNFGLDTQVQEVQVEEDTQSDFLDDVEDVEESPSDENGPEENDPQVEVISETRVLYTLLVDPNLNINLNVRSGIGTSNELVYELEPGSLVGGLEESNGWYKLVLPNGSVGWASGVYLSVVEDEE